jgi:hypothetical protein
MSQETTALHRTPVTPPPAIVNTVGTGSDRLDEQLSTGFVRRCVEMVLEAAGLDPTFFLVAPTATDRGRSACTLFADLPPTSIGFARLLARSIDGQLRNDEGYARLRASGELATLKIFAIDRNRCEPNALFAVEMLKRGCCPGRVGFPAFDSASDWGLIFPGDYLV